MVRTQTKLSLGTKEIPEFRYFYQFLLHRFPFRKFLIPLPPNGRGMRPAPAELPQAGNRARVGGCSGATS